MSIGYFKALVILNQTFRKLPLASRLHILVRFITCPFLRTLYVVPTQGRILDIGAGHGTFARLAVEQGAREVIAVEPDLRKALLPIEAKGVRFVAGFDEAIRGMFDAVVIYDATYRIPLEERERLYKRAYERIRPGGLFVLKDLDPDHRLKMSWARLQEWLSDTFLKISIGDGFIYEARASLADRLARIGFIDFRAHEIDAGYPHAHIIYTARKPGTRD